MRAIVKQVWEGLSKINHSIQSTSPPDLQLCITMHQVSGAFGGDGGLPTLTLTRLVRSDRSSYSDDVLLYICSSSGKFRFSLSPLMQLMLQESNYRRDCSCMTMQMNKNPASELQRGNLIFHSHQILLHCIAGVEETVHIKTSSLEAPIQCTILELGIGT